MRRRFFHFTEIDFCLGVQIRLVPPLFQRFKRHLKKSPLLEIRFSNLLEHLPTTPTETHFLLVDKKQNCAFLQVEKHFFRFKLENRESKSRQSVRSARLFDGV
jgi:hypothetical protein